MRQLLAVDAVECLVLASLLAAQQNVDGLVHHRRGLRIALWLFRLLPLSEAACDLGEGPEILEPELGGLRYTHSGA